MNPQDSVLPERLIARQRQAGLSLPAAIFVITVMALLAVAINAMVAQSSQTYQEEINLTRALYAADSGAGFAMNTIFPPEGFPGYGAPATCAAGPRVYSFTVPGLNACEASVTCSSKAVSGVDFATITSVGSCDDIERTVQVRTQY